MIIVLDEPELYCGMAWRGMVKREGGVYAVLHVATRKYKYEEADVSDGVQLGTLLSLYGVERTYHCIVSVLLPGTLESSFSFHLCLPCSPLS